MSPTQKKKWFKGLAGLLVLLFVGTGIWLLSDSERIPRLLLGTGASISRPGTNLSMGDKLGKSNSPPTGPVISLNFETLGGWKYVAKKTPIPQKVLDLDGREIEVSGIILPINYSENMKTFLLMQSLWDCCFGQSPDPNHVVVVEMEGEKVVQFHPDPVKITGILHVREIWEEEFLVSIYQLKASKVVQAKRSKPPADQ